MKLAFIGGGMMGEAVLAAVLSNQLADPGDVAVCEIVSQRQGYLREKFRVRVTEHPAEAIEGADIVVLAVKPQEFAGAAGPLGGQLKPGQTVISIMAGVTVASIQDSLGHEAVVRAIPNTPAQIGEGMTVWTATASVTEAAHLAVRRLLSALGREIYVTEEKHVDMATAVSSSGPAYIFLVLEALIDAAVHIGLRREVAEPMAIQTLLGSARYAEASGKHPAELRNQVTSPGGTTTEGLRALETAGLRAAFIEAVEAAYDKARKLGG